MTELRSIKLLSFARRTSLREQVADALRAAVVSGEMRPGEIYSAPTLAAAFGVSATPVREAMLDLAKQSLIEVIPNKGFQVTRVTDAELDQITEIRLLLEPPAAVLAAEKATPEDVTSESVSVAAPATAPARQTLALRTVGCLVVSVIRPPIVGAAERP